MDLQDEPLWDTAILRVILEDCRFCALSWIKPSPAASETRMGCVRLQNGGESHHRTRWWLLGGYTSGVIAPGYPTGTVDRRMGPYASYAVCIQYSAHIDVFSTGMIADFGGEGTPRHMRVGQRGDWGPSVDHQFGGELRRAQSHCSRGLVVKILCYKNTKLTLTTRQLHSRELFAAAAPTDVVTGTVDRRVGVVYVVNYIFSAHILVCFPPK